MGELQSERKLAEIETVARGKSPGSALSVVQSAPTLAKTQCDKKTRDQKHCPGDGVLNLERSHPGKAEETRLSFPRQWDFSKSLSIKGSKTAIAEISSTLPRSFFISDSQFYIPSPESTPLDFSRSDGILYPDFHLPRLIVSLIGKRDKGHPIAQKVWEIFERCWWVVADSGGCRFLTL
ncbi:MAG: hypothetical protein ACRC8Y_07870 [Chroococcales cyanobacterium]